jgi:MinD superfamily P-loop ATPase
VPQMREDGAAPARGPLPPGDVSGLRDGHDPAALSGGDRISSVKPREDIAAPEETTMRIAFASGKGGTGKTILATNLAVFLADRDEEVTYLDCDVEAPNGHIFLKPHITSREAVTIPIPEVDEARCTRCGRCSEVCQAHAIVCLGDVVLTFPELCHGCGGCALVCPEKAIREIPREIGEIARGTAGSVAFVEGRLRTGQAKSPPVIRAVKRHLPRTGIAILDAPPGTSCPLLEAIRDADFVLLVAEPTVFGLHDLTLAVEAVRKVGIPHGVAINRAGPGGDGVQRYCARSNLPVLIQIPEDRRIAEIYSRGDLAVRSFPGFARWMTELFDRLRGAVRR